MSPISVLRAELALLKLSLRNLPAQAPSIGLAFGGLLALSAAAYAGLTVAGPVGYRLMHAHAHTPPSQQTAIIIIAGLAVFGLLVSVSVAGFCWRRADAMLGGRAPSERTPALTLIKGGVFTVMLVGGGLVVAAVGLYAIPFRLHSVGVPHPYDQWVVAAALALLYVPLLLRASLLLPVIAVDHQKVVAAWHMILQTARGKSLPLLAAHLFQAVLAVPFIYAADLLAGEQSRAWVRTAGTQVKPALLLTQPAYLAAALVLAVMFSLQAAVQVGLARHFFGFSSDDNQQSKHLVVSEFDQREDAGKSALQGTPNAALAAFDVSALEDADEDLAVAPQLYQPESAPPMPPASAPSAAPAMMAASVPDRQPPMPAASSANPTPDVEHEVGLLASVKPPAVKPPLNPSPPALAASPTDDEDPFADLHIPNETKASPTESDDPFADLR